MSGTKRTPARVDHGRSMTAWTPEEWAEIVARRGRNITDGPMREAARWPDGTPENRSVIDQYLGGIGGGDA